MGTSSHKPSQLAAFAEDRRYRVMLALGFSSGLPLLLVYVTQVAWLSDVHVATWVIVLLSEMTIAYKLKFLWAPLLDRHAPPLLEPWLGRRRGWLIWIQVGVVLALTGVAFGDPAHRLWWTILFSLALGFFGATQDVVIDGWRINAVPAGEPQTLLTSWAEIGWRIGTFAAGAGALLLSDHVGWRAAYLCMAALMLPGLVATLLAPVPEPDLARKDPEKPTSLFATIVIPIKDLVTRLGPMALPILLMVSAFRMPGYIAMAVAPVLFKALHYSNTDIATVTKFYGVWVALGGTLLAGYIVPRIGMMASLLVGTVVGSASHLSLAYLAAHGDHGGGEFWLFAVAVSIDGFAYAFASVILITYMSSLTSAEHAAPQYALLTSLVALPGSLLAGLSAFVIEPLGFTWFFVLTSLIGMPAALLCWLVGRQTEMRPEPAV